jgi:FkbM family methyltransferase
MMVTLSSGAIISGPSKMCVHFLSFGFSDLSEHTFLHHVTHEGDVMVDIGAGIGSYCLPMAMLGAKVHAFEPASHARQTLRDNVSANGLQERVIIYDVAVGSAPGRATITREYASGNRITEDDVPGVTETDSVEVTTLDEWAIGKDLENLRLIKIDAEGMDEQVILGAQHVLGCFQPTLIVEYLNGTHSLERLLRSSGYSSYTYDLRSHRLVPFHAPSGSGNIIACTAVQHQAINTRLASRSAPRLERPLVQWAPSASVGAHGE